MEAKKLKLSQTINSSAKNDSATDLRASKNNPLANSIEVAKNGKEEADDEYYDEEI